MLDCISKQPEGFLFWFVFISFFFLCNVRKQFAPCSNFLKHLTHIPELSRLLYASKLLHMPILYSFIHCLFLFRVDHFFRNAIDYVTISLFHIELAHSSTLSLQLERKVAHLKINSPSMRCFCGTIQSKWVDRNVEIKPGFRVAKIGLSPLACLNYNSMNSHIHW